MKYIGFALAFAKLGMTPYQVSKASRLVDAKSSIHNHLIPIEYNVPTEHSMWQYKLFFKLRDGISLHVPTHCWNYLVVWDVKTCWY